MRRLNRSIFSALVVTCLAFAPVAARVSSGHQAAPAASRATLPERLSDAEFWKLVTDISEPGGYFRITDNYTSNEGEIGRVATMLRDTGVKGGVYMGVGPEQNFSYIAAIRPAMAFVVDIRRQAVMQHLMFKAVFEIAPERADFIAVLFSKPRPAGLDASSSIQKIWDAFTPVATDVAMGPKTYSKLFDSLTKTHGFKFTEDESSQLRAVWDAFQLYGPSITTRGAGGGGNALTFADLTGWMVDTAGQPQSFMSTEDNYKYVKSLEDRNLVVPVSGDFGGPKTIRAIGAYIREHGSTVSAFYLSNVEQYLFMDGKEKAFLDNVETLPVTETSVFIRPYALRNSNGRPLCAITPFLTSFRGGRVNTNNDALACPR